MIAINQRKHLLFLTLFVSVLFLAWLWYTLSGGSWHKVRMEPGTEIFAIQEKQIRRFVYEGSISTLTATRKNIADSDFQIDIKFNDGRLSDRCISGNTFKSVLSSFCSIRVKRAFQDKSAQRSYPIDLGSVVIEDFSKLSPATWKFKSTTTKSAVLAIDEMQSYEVDIGADSFDKLNSGCKNLAAQ